MFLEPNLHIKNKGSYEPLNLFIEPNIIIKKPSQGFLYLGSYLGSFLIYIWGLNLEPFLDFWEVLE